MTAERVRSWNVRPAPELEAREAGYREAARQLDDERRCPICQQQLRGFDTDKEKHGACIHLDVCQAHGTFFDRGEAWTLFQSAQLVRMAASFSVEMDTRDAAWSAKQQGPLWVELFFPNW